MNMKTLSVAVWVSSLAGFLYVPLASAEVPVEMNGQITVDSAISCEASVTAESSAIDLSYTVTQANIDANAPGTFTNLGTGTADYVASAGASGNCAVNSLAVQLPVFPGVAGAYATKVAGSGGQWFLANTYLSNLEVFPTANGSGTQSGLVLAGVGYGRNIAQALGGNGGISVAAGAGWTGGSTVTNVGGYKLSDEGTTDTAVLTNVFFSSKASFTNATSYGVAGYSSWPFYNMKNSKAGLPGFMNGAPNGAYVGLQSTALVGVQSVRVSIGVVLSQAVLTGSVADTGGVVNGESMSGTGTITFTWA